MLLSDIVLFGLRVKINTVYIKFCGIVHIFNNRALEVII